jgi:hypothetical protein
VDQVNSSRQRTGRRDAEEEDRERQRKLAQDSCENRLLSTDVQGLANRYHPGD